MRVSKTSKVREWLGLARERPLEAFDRAVTVLDVKRDRAFAKLPTLDSTDWDGAVAEFARRYSGDLSALLAEADVVEREIATRSSERLANGTIDHIHSADSTLARLCYIACRLRKPSVVLETGVAYGVTSSFILEALRKNGGGVLHSIDLPPLGPHVKDYVGVLVADDMRHSWHLHRGATKRVLPQLLPTLSVDIFVHDSLHTYQNISRELKLVAPKLTAQAVVIADDIHENTAFEDWIIAKKPTYSAVVQEDSKESFLGLALFDD